MTSTTDNPENDRSEINRGLIPGDAALESPRSYSAAIEPDMWRMFAEISQNLQMLSASIKAAITSLLDTSIIWDKSSQHEFMESINQSIDRSIPLIVAMTLAMKSVGGTLEWIIEPNSIQEILSRVADAMERDGDKLPVTLSLPADGKPVLVDYDYLRIALKMLLDALLSTHDASSGALRIEAIEDITHWEVHIDGGFTGSAAELIAWLEGSAIDKDASFPPGINSEVMLRAFTALQILNQQGIYLSIPARTTVPVSIILIIPSTGQ